MKTTYLSNRWLIILLGMLFIQSTVFTTVYGQKKNSKEKNRVENKADEKEKSDKPEFKVYYFDTDKRGTYELDYEIKARFTKYSKERDFQNTKRDLKNKFDIDFDYKNLKFNKEDELIAAEISVKTKEGNSGTYIVKEGEPVEPFGFIIRGDEFRIGKVFNDLDEEGIIKLNDNIEIRPFKTPYFKRFRNKYEADNIFLQDILEKFQNTLKNLGEKIERLEFRLEKKSNDDVILRENKPEEISHYYFNGKEIDKETMNEFLRKLDAKGIKLIAVTKRPQGGKALEIIIKDDNSL